MISETQTARDRFLAVSEGGRESKTHPRQVIEAQSAQSDFACVPAPNIKENTLENFLFLWLRIKHESTKADREKAS
jgi:hypothetical protein